jgi:hypothetical protein
MVNSAIIHDNEKFFLIVPIQHIQYCIDKFDNMVRRGPFSYERIIDAGYLQIYFNGCLKSSFEMSKKNLKCPNVHDQSVQKLILFRLKKKLIIITKMTSKATQECRLSFIALISQLSEIEQKGQEFFDKM